MLEPGRIIVIGSIKDPLEELIKEFGRPELNRMTKTDIRPAGVFSQTAYKGLRQYIFGSIDDSPRSWNKEV